MDYRTVPDDPRINTYGQDAGYCHQCGEHLDSGFCECLRCYECAEVFQHESEIVEVTIHHVKTKEPVKVKMCGDCAEKLDDRPQPKEEET